ncbi:MAG: hypothetical protein OXH00_05850 [Candidatus Poribacteria bacterium]|nr:hypothetical protein [Candidatus Poribacteria bacterium]
MIGIYNWGSTRINHTFIQNVMKCAAPKPEVCKELSGLKKHKIAIAHVSCEGWKQLIKEYSSSGNVRVRVTTDDDFRNKPPPKTNKDDVYVFNLVLPTGNVSAADWKEILCGLSGEATIEALVRGENLNGLRRFFVHEVQEHLSALAILCVGYLAVHAEDETDQTDISPTLALMKWTKFRNSDRYTKLIRLNLGEKKDDVRQPEWWLDVFEQKSFYEDVKKEWKNTTGVEEIPTELNNLLAAIHSGESVVPPTIVADAYGVLQKRKLITSESEWQIRRNKFNHDWLKNKFLNSFNDFVEQLQKPNPNIVRVSEFLVEDFHAWKSRRQDAQWIVQSFEDSMSPRQLLDCSPLNRCDDDTREWLGRLVHGLWLSRYPVKKKSQESQNALVTVNKFYEKIMDELRQSKPIKLTTLISLRPQFCELKQTYEALSKTLSNLPQEG